MPSIFKAVFLSTILLFPLASVAQSSHQYQKTGWSYSLGLGGIIAPSYLGSDDYHISIMPNLRLAYGDTFFASVSEGIGYRVIKNDRWNIGPLAKYDFGRDEEKGSPFNIDGDDTTDLLGLGDVDGTIELGGFIEYNLRPFLAKIEILKGTGGHEGIISNLSIKYAGRAHLLNKNIMYNIGPKLTVADANYHQSYFGINTQQSNASGLTQYNADAGILSYGLSGMIIVPINRHLSTTLFTNYSKLGSEAANSPLVQQRGSENQGTLGLFLSYRFSYK